MNETTPPNGLIPVRAKSVPLPTPIPTSIRGYMYTDELLWLFHAAWMTKAQGIKGDLLEIGSFEGLSASALAQAGHLTCVDTWDFVHGTVDSRNSFEAFNNNIAAMGLTKKVAAKVGNSATVLPKLAASGAKFRLIFVDGDHSYEAALHDIYWSWEMLSPGGILVVDDYYGHEPVQRACAASGGKLMAGGIGKMAYKAKEIS